MANNTAIINLKVDPETKAQAQAIAKELGLSLSAVINAQLKQLIKTKTIYLSLNEIPTEESIRSYESARAEVEKEGYKPKFKSNQVALEYFRDLADR